MNNKADPNKKHYFDKIEINDLSDVLSNMPKSHILSLWEKGKNEEIIEEFGFVSYDSSLKRIFLEYNKGLLSKLKGSSLEEKSIGFRFNLDRLQYFSVSKLFYDKDKGLYFFDITSDVYLAQQRKNYRLNSDGNINIELVIGHHVLRCLDISAGGTSILVPSQLFSQFNEGQEYENCPLTFNDDTYVIDKIKLVKKFETDDAKEAGAVCYGIQFVKFEPAAEESLALKINSEARAKEIRKKMAEFNARKQSK